MNEVKISTDGVCVYVHSKIKCGRSPKIIFGSACLAVLSGIVLINLDDENPLGAVLLLGGLVFTLPMLRTTLWNFFGQETISISTKSIWCQHDYGFFKPNAQTYNYTGNLRFDFSVVRSENNIEEGEIYFISYDERNQPFNLFKTTILMTQENYIDLVNKIQLVFALDGDVISAPSLN